jgi:hypothetical protein
MIATKFDWSVTVEKPAAPAHLDAEVAVSVGWRWAGAVTDGPA